ncbi:MAG TPA: hypothetical protein VFV50_07375 [Bdellovibrionales bacterium]|nr:hypothetical protein [Bdellovibrionales bacterium]
MDSRKEGPLKPRLTLPRRRKQHEVRHEGETPIPFAKDSIHSREISESEGEDRRPSRIRR